MVEYDTGDALYIGRDIDDITAQIKAENVELNRRFGTRKPYPEDYGTIYNTVRKGLYDLGLIAKHKSGVQDGLKERVATGRVSFRDAINASKSLVNLSVGAIVEQDEMNRRAKICSSCSLVNRNLDCATCKMSALVSATINSVRKFAGKQLNYPPVGGHRANDANCGYCGCSMLNILPAKISVFNESEEKNEGRPGHCWVKKGSRNFIEEA